ncbi:MAG: hypothetical protein ACRC1L_12585 [Prochlorococcaceae cyanobacterium]
MTGFSSRLGTSDFADSWNGGLHLVYVDGMEFACCADRSEGLRLMYGVLSASISPRIHLLKI